MNISDFQVTQIYRSGRFLEWRLSDFSHPETGLELRNRFYTTDWATTVCVFVVFSFTADTKVYTCVLLVCTFRRNRFKKQVQNLNSVEETFELYWDVKKETYDEKYIDDENEKNLDKGRHI